MATSSETPGTGVSEKDLQRIAEVVSIFAAAQDALTDDMIARMAGALSEGITLLDRLTRNEDLMRLLRMLDHPDVQCHLVSLANSVQGINRDLATAPPLNGGIGGMIKLISDPGTQEGLRIMSIIGKHWGEGLRELHRAGGEKGLKQNQAFP